MSAPGPARMDLQWLGPPRLLLDGQPVALPTRKACALLLLLAVGGSVARPRLCAWLWPDLDESSARRNLRRELARLREVGAGAAIRADGDRLLPGPDLTHDLARAEALVCAGEPEAALALWRGDAAEGLVADGGDDMGLAAWLAEQRQHARALHRRARETSAEAAEARGDLATALASVQALLADDALQERQHRAAMRLLAASGDRAGALRQFEACRALLAAELGLEPAPETAALAQSLRAPAPTRPTASVAELPPAHPPSPEPALSAVRLPQHLPFVGRVDEVARMQKAWSRRQPVILVGESGVGKTRLAADFAATQGPYAVLRAQRGDGQMPLASYARALRELAGDPADLSALEPWVAAELARLLPELGPPLPPLRNAEDRRRFDEACLRAWHALAGASFDTVVLDDWQWADAASRALWARAAARRRKEGGGAIEILTWRGHPDEAELLASTDAMGAEMLVLAPLDDAAVQELVRQLSGSADPLRFAQRLRSATGGHPYFIDETLRDLAERALLRGDMAGRWCTPFDDDAAGYQDLPLPPSVRDAVQARVRRLGAASLRLLEAAALAAEPFGAAGLAQACALSELKALDALDGAVRANLVTASDGGGYAWAHDLARSALASTLGPTRRRLLHHRLAVAAEAQGARAEAARHFEACGEPARAVPHRLAAGDTAHALHAPAEAAAQWRLGLADGPARADEAVLLARLCEVEWLQGHADEARALHARLRDLLSRPPEAAVPPDVRLDVQLAAVDYLSKCGQLPQALAGLDALPMPPVGPARLRWWRLRADVLHQLGRIDEAAVHGEHALQNAPPRSRERAEVLMSLATLAHSDGRMADAVAHADASIALFDWLGDPAGRARAQFYRGITRIDQGDIPAAEADLRATAAAAVQRGNVYLQRLALYNLAAAHSNHSRPAEALAVAHEAWPTLAETPLEEMALVFRSMFIECHFQLGEWGPMWDHLAPAVAGVMDRSAMLRMSIANCAPEPAALLGRWDLVEPLVQLLDDTGVFDEVPVAAEIALGCAHAARVRGDLAGAAAWLARVHPQGEAEHPRVRCRAALLRVEQALDAGAGPEALHALPADDAPGMSPELRMRALLPRWRAGAVPQEVLLAALEDPSAHVGVALLLARALGGEVEARHRERAAASLAGWPELQRSFVATWR